MVLVMIIAFLFLGCADGERDNPYDQNGINYNSSLFGISSSSARSSSSSAPPPSSSSLANVVYGTPVNYGGETYPTVIIGTQTWFAKNLNYDPGTGNSGCYDCATYGRLYDWSTAMNLPSSCNSTTCSGQVQSKHKGICPSGWHIPSNADWDKLFRFVDGTNGTSSPYDSPTAGKHLKAKNGWYDCGPSGSGSSYLCEDTHGFSALPGGYGNSGGRFSIVGSNGNWWSAGELNSGSAFGRSMYYSSDYAYYGSNKDYLWSVRCLQD